MMKESFYTICYSWIAIALFIHILMFFIKAPFGRHSSEKWGPTINNKVGWIIMEFPSLAIMVYFLIINQNNKSLIWILFLLWIFHYFNRTIIYPLRIRPTEKKMPLFIMFSAIFFNVMNAGLNGYYNVKLADPLNYGKEWLNTWNFVIGVILFISGITINWISDSILISLRKPGEIGYKIPEGFLFKYITCPNLFGEIMEWAGYALIAWNIPALTFAVWTYSNLVPRAKNHYDWYLENFKNFPKGKKIIFPFIY